MTTRIGLGLATAGAGLVVAAVHGAETPAVHGATTAAFTAPAAAPPVAAAPSPVAVHVTAHSLVRVAPHKRGIRRSSAHRSSTHRSSTHRSTTHTRNMAHRPARRIGRRPAPSFTGALMEQVARIPTYHAGQARWVVSRAYDFWGTADWYHDVLYVSPDVPRDKLYDVAVHEWSHELSVLDYSGDVDAATAAMNEWFGGSGLTGAERAADCMAILQGATWTHYTTCNNSKWRAGAQTLISGHPLS